MESHPSGATFTFWVHPPDYNPLKGLNLTQTILISTTVGKNPLEEMEKPLYSTKELEMQYLGAISKTTE